MNKKAVLLSVCLSLSPVAAAGGVDFDQGVDIPGFLVAASVAGSEVPGVGVRSAGVPDWIVAEFQTMGRHEGGRVDAQGQVPILPALMSRRRAAAA